MRECVFFFNFSFDEICSISDVFEKSILCEYGANQLSGCRNPNTSDKDRSSGEHSNEDERMKILNQTACQIQSMQIDQGVQDETCGYLAMLSSFVVRLINQVPDTPN